jgi:hypothetical protein
VSPDGGAGWDEPPLDIQIPDDARELERDVLAYRRELRAKRRRSRLRRLGSPFAGQGTIMPLLASILAVCLVAGAMLSVATFSPAVAPDHHHPTATASVPQGASTRSAATASGSASPGRSASGRAARTASPSAKSNPSSTASHNRPPGGP